MVSFSVFNEMSLPLETYTAQAKFGTFFKLLEELKNKGLNKIRMTADFSQYYILNNTSFEKFYSKQTDRDFKQRLTSFITNTITTIETPIIKKQEQEQQNIIANNEYFYADDPTSGGLACCDIWNTMAVSFNSCEQWDKDYITIKKNTLENSGNIKNSYINIKHAADIEHLATHHLFFADLKTEFELNITQNTFWNNRTEYFPSIIKFCPEVERQISKLDKIIFQLVINILRDVETERKSMKDFNFSVESNSVRTNPKTRTAREFTVNREKVFFNLHLKSLPNGYRIYFLEQSNKIYIGYIGKHLPTALFK